MNEQLYKERGEGGGVARKSEGERKKEIVRKSERKRGRKKD